MIIFEGIIMIDVRIGQWVSVDAGDLELGSHDPLEHCLGNDLHDLRLQ